MEFRRDRVQENVRQASTEDLLDRATMYSAGMEPDALDMIQNELRDRGVSAADIRRYDQEMRPIVLFDDRGVARVCCQCRRPAVFVQKEWHQLLGLIPLFPIQGYYCDRHRPTEVVRPADDSPLPG